MRKPKPSIDNLRIASPCSVGWENMTGDQQVRFCDLCNLHIYNISEMTASQVRALILNTEGRVCGRLYRRADGSVMTSDCPVGLRAIRRKVARLAGTALAAVLSMVSIVFSQSPSRKEQSNTGSSKLKIKRTASQSGNVTLTGSIADEFGALISGAEVLLTNELTKSKTESSTTAAGEFSFSSLPAGKYTMEVRAPGFKQLKLKRLEIGSNEQVRAEIILKVNGETVIVGIFDATPSFESSGGTTIIRSEIIQKLPLPD